MRTNPSQRSRWLRERSAGILCAVDDRPAVWVGHVVIYASDVPRSAKWWGALGMRTVHNGEDMAIFELRGGTRLLIFPAESRPTPGQAPFDLMADDVEATRVEFAARGLAPTPLAPAPGSHQTFAVTDPDGYVLTVSNSHVMGKV
jgi:catechol 2,3-dioxygenase-like lactoylglutathione lyase family enzyme